MSEAFFPTNPNEGVPVDESLTISNAPLPSQEVSKEDAASKIVMHIPVGQAAVTSAVIGALQPSAANIFSDADTEGENVVVRHSHHKHMWEHFVPDIDPSLGSLGPDVVGLTEEQIIKAATAVVLEGVRESSLPDYANSEQSTNLTDDIVLEGDPVDPNSYLTYRGVQIVADTHRSHFGAIKRTLQKVRSKVTDFFQARISAFTQNSA